MGKQYHQTESGLYVPGSVRGKVQDIKIFDNYGKGNQKLVDYMEGGDNTISSGASFNVLANTFFPYSSYNNLVSGGVNTGRYKDANNNLFPGLMDMNNTSTTAQSSYNAQAPWTTTFGGIAGIKGGSGGLPSHVCSLSGVNLAWEIVEQYVTGSYDLATNPASAQLVYGGVTSSVTPTISNTGVPSVGLTITITSTSSATAYTIDSIGWLPVRNAQVQQNYYMTIGTSAPTVAVSAPVWSSNSASPTTISNLAISALFVLPYLVTVNANGAIQFTYTFQGA